MFNIAMTFVTASFAILNAFLVCIILAHGMAEKGAYKPLVPVGGEVVANLVQAD